MKRVLIALAMIAVSVFMAAPAIAQEDSTGSTEPPASTEAPTTPPAEDPPSEDAPSPEDVQESPSAPETTEPEVEANAPDAEGGFQALAVVEQVTICHARSAETNPYGPQAQTVSVNSVLRPNGHAALTGPVFPAANWGDIIPPFVHEWVLPRPELGLRRTGDLLQRLPGSWR